MSFRGTEPTYRSGRFMSVAEGRTDLLRRGLRSVDGPDCDIEPDKNTSLANIGDDPYYEGRLAGFTEAMRGLGWIDGRNLKLVIACSRPRLTLARFRA